MASFRLRESAEEDLVSIARVSRQFAGEAHMRRYLAKLDHAFHLLAGAPELGQSCEHIRPGYRRLPQGSHVIFYRITPDGIVDVVRLLHERMQPDLHLGDDE